MIVRELVAKLGFVSDHRSFAVAEQNIDKTKKAMGGFKNILADIGRSMAAVFAGGAILMGVKNIVTFASDANETLNVLNESFGANSQNVQDWAQEFGAAAGRSQYAMREMAGELGAVLNPLLGNNASLAAEMSKNLGGLAVDLGSFFNTTDADALLALRSGLTGQTEPLLKYGVVMLQVNLEEYRKREGIKKSVKQMTNIEKTQLRYNYIMSQTKNAQGDAARTSEGFANATKGLTGSFRDLATGIGLKVLPTIEAIINFTRKGVAAFTLWTQQSKIVEVALVALAVVAAAAGLKILVAWLPVILPVLAVAAAIAAVIVVVDEFLTFLDGGDSMIGRFIDSLMGPGSATEASKNLREGFAALSHFFQNDFVNAIQGIRDFVGFLVSDFQAAKDKIAGVFEWLNTKIKDVTGIDIKAAIKWVGGSLNDLIADTTGVDIAATNDYIKDRKERKIRKDEERVKKEADRKARGEYTIDELLAQKEKKQKEEQAIKDNKIKKKNKEEAAKLREKNEKSAEKIKTKEAKAYAKKQGYTVAKQVPNAKGILKAPVTVNHTSNTNVIVKGDVSRSNANNLAEKVSQKVGNVNKRTLNALVQVGE